MVYTKVMKSVEELYEQDRPRERLINKGPAALKDFELMAVLLGSGVQGKDVLKLSREIIRLFEKDFDGLDVKTLCTVHGLGPAKAAQILSAIELSRRYLIKPGRQITSAADVYKELSAYHHRKQEYFLVLTLDGASHLITTRVISIGTLNQSLVHPREVFADAISDRAAGIIIAHNHPSGQCFPSQEDKAVTHRLKEVGEIVGIALLDHLIFTHEGYHSLLEEGLL